MNVAIIPEGEVRTVIFPLDDVKDGGVFVRSTPTLAVLMQKKEDGTLTHAEFVAIHLWMKIKTLSSDDPQIMKLS